MLQISMARQNFLTHNECENTYFTILKGANHKLFLNSIACMLEITLNYLLCAENNCI